MGLFSKKPKISRAELQLKQQQAQNSLRIVNDCIKIISETKNPDVFFSRYNLLIEHTENLLALQHFVSFSGPSLSSAYVEVINNKQIAIKDFLNRYWADTLSKITNLKTEPAKIKRIQTFYDSLEKYKHEMNEENIDFFITKYNIYLKK